MTQGEAVQRTEREYASQRAKNESERDARVAEVRQKIPEIARLQAELAAAFADGARRALVDGAQAAHIAQALRTRAGDVQRQIACRLEAAGFPQNYMDIRCRCGTCRDTGYVGEDMRGRCQCFTQRVLALRFEHAEGLPEHSFERFDERLYPSASQRAQAVEARNLLETYAERFPESGALNLLLLGASGLGKTFLLDSVARRISERGYVTLRISAFRMFEGMRAYHMGENQSGTAFEQMLNCPCLLIDDLGAEPMFKNITVEYLFTLLSERAAARRHTAIATNLSLVQLAERYGERVVSRLLDRSTTEIIRLSGEDLRTRRN